MVSVELLHTETHESHMMGAALDWATTVRHQMLGPFLWHMLGRHCRDADLIIAQQEVKYLRCHMLLLKSRIWGPKFAYWGHGRNFQARNPNSVAEKVKKFLSRRVDWWFAYNDLSARVVESYGYPTSRITSILNTIDINPLIEARRNLRKSDLSSLRQELNLKSENIGIYTGGLYSIKRVGFLLESVQKIREQITDFELIVIGDGCDRMLVEEAATKHSWIHYVGVKKSTEKVPYWALSKVLLMPGGVGLVITDSFALGVPMITTDTTLHGPEIEYLKNGENGMLVECGDSPAAYSDAVVRLLKDTGRLNKMRLQALESAKYYTIEVMAERFCKGVIQALDSSRL